MEKVLIIGSSGMLGHMVYLYLKEKQVDVFGIDCSPSITTDELVNLLDRNALSKISNEYNFDYVINCAAILGEKITLLKEESYKINVLVPLGLPKQFPQSKIIHISTDYVFSGCKPLYYSYNYLDKRTNKTPYGIQKRSAESKQKNVINLRLSIIGPSLFPCNSLFNAVFAKPNIDGFINSYSTLITTLEASKKIYEIISNNLFSNIIQIPSKTHFSKYELLLKIKNTFNQKTVINPIHSSRYSNYSLANNGVCSSCLSIDEQLNELKCYMKKKINIYQTYFKTEV